MKTRLILPVLVAAMLTIAADGCPVGRDFLTAFMANFKTTNYYAGLQLAITAHKTNANVRLEVKGIRYTNNVLVKKRSTVQVPIPSKAEIWGSGSSGKTLQISSDADISVVAFNYKASTGDSSIVFPIAELDTKYMIYTPETVSKKHDKLVAIINGDRINKVNLLPYRDMKVKGMARWKKGVKVTITMAPYEVYQLRSRVSLTGTEIKAQRPVAVLAGHQCAKGGIFCSHLYQQLLPVQKLTTHWLVPVLHGPRDVVHVLAINDKTTVNIVRGRKTKTKTLKAGNMWDTEIGGNIPLIINSNKKVMVMYYSRNHPYNPFFISILPLSELSNNWSLDTQAAFTSTAVIICEANGAKTTRMDGRLLSSKAKWKRFPGDSTFLWTSLSLGKSQRHYSITSDALTAVYFYGSRLAHSYSAVGVCYKGSPPPHPSDPCDYIKCREKEGCRKGVCVSIAKATCRALGDLHYTTFDGKRFDFQGTCTYTLSATVGNVKGLIPFTVLAKNNHRGNKYVSFVRKVTVIVYGQTITISKRKGKVEVNGIKSHLPVSLARGKLHVVRRQFHAVLTTDFGLEVSYDWKSSLFITVPSSYFGSVSGLCGNYNGNRKDDFTTPAGKKASAVLEFAKSWKIKDGDSACDDSCRGKCPSCSVELQEKYRAEEFCGLMAEKGGPFAKCHKTLEPDMFVDNCVYDVCMNKGLKRLLCDSMESYVSACNSEGVTFTGSSWREFANCTMECPVKSHYEACGTACPASCVNLENLVCPKVCVEGCQCDKGFVLSGNTCVHKKRCGCTHDGLYYKPGQEFWADNTCTTRCKCNKDTTKVECYETKCKKGQVCDLRKGVRECYPVSFATCHASGDPHYTTFDGKRYDFQGTCTYLLSKLLKTDDPSLVPFDVQVQNENRGANKRVSYTKAVEITVYGNTAILSRERPGKVLLNGLYTSLPLELEDGKLSIIRNGYFGVVSTDFGLKLKFDWHSKVKLTLPGPYSGKLGCLCGNWNGDATDDMVTPDNRPAKSVAVFGESWKSRDDPHCSSDCGGQCPKCDPKSMPRYQKRELCGMITNPDGPFKLCHGKVSPDSYFDDCVYDMCLNDGHASALCSALTAYTEACQEALAQVGVWRSDDFCPTGCKENSYYEVCATACPFSCLDLFEPGTCDEAAACAEGCVCDEGFVLSDGECVLLTDCGCAHDDRYYEMGQVFFPEGLCAARCVCLEGGVVRCDRNFSCGPDEKCQVKDGVRACFPDGAGTCSVFGASTYHSFDSRSFNTFGNCVFILAQVTTAAVQRIPFTVSVKQESIPGELPVTRSVEIKVNGLKIALFPGAIWEAEVDGEKFNLPWSLDDEKVQVFQNGLYIVVVTDFGLKVRYDSVSGVITEVPSTYKGIMHGLCGNYNGDPDDDFTMPSGLPASTLDFFVEAWVVLLEDAQCQVRCGSKCPSPDEGKKPDAETACRILTENDGPFAQCHLAVPPQKYFEECVQEMIKWQVNTTLCPHIQRYAALCQAIGVTIKEWRTKTFCHIQCPEKSHYELCADTCTSTCASLSVSSRCPHCHEGCQCDEGFVSDGGTCVPLGSCGCVVNGRYFKFGESEMQEECTKKCNCKNGEFSCKDTSCTDTEMCLVKKGVMGCYKDPCEEKECRVKEGCTLVGNEAVCVPDSKAFCWAMGDPHYQTFDGKHVSFQGTCSYTLVKTTGKDQTLPAFTIETRNGVRGNPEGSFLRSIFIKLKGHTIFIPFMDHGKLLINDIVTNMPVSLENGTIKITQTGIKGTLMTDFGLEIVFDWISMFMVTVSSSYYDNLAGLCGTYNENQTDDFKTPGGSIAVSITEWAKSWAVEEVQGLCWHFCHGVCPTCSQEAYNMYETEKYCGSIIQKDGPFNPCHGIVEPDEHASNCIYDVCANDGRQDVLCEALATYVAACLETETQNIVDPKWREITNCAWPCPENSHYELCSSPCPATCAEPDGRDNCSLPCTEGCHCDAGLVLSGDKCVLFETGCGCMQGDRYYRPDETFWEDDECQSKCTCDGKTQTVRCEKRGCAKHEHCGVVGGVRGCYPTSFNTCLARGNPHFKTFDGMRFDFQGNCIYWLAMVCSTVDELEQFNITLENNNRGSQGVSFPKAVTVYTAHAVFTFSRNFPGRVLVDGVLTALPFYLNGTVVRIYRRGRLAVLETHFGLTVTYDWKSSVHVTVPSTYHGAICGLCGNYNGDPNDDLRLPGGALAKNPAEFGDSQLVGETPGCSPVCTDCASPLLEPGTPLPEYVSQCDIITDRAGPLRDCRDKAESLLYHESCVIDVHLNQGLQKVVCDLIEAYIEDCQEGGGKIEEWRNKDFCAFSCPVNSAYNLTAPGCPPTCYSMAAPPGCKASCREGCQCDPGFMLSDEQCVPLHDCGCSHEGRYYKSGAAFYTDRTCRKHCTCSSGVVDCQASACGPQETCSLVDAVLGCFPKSNATCVFSGDSYFRTFDGRGFDFWGPCGYTLVQGSKAAGQRRFHVSAQMEPRKKSVLLESVMVDVFGHSLVLERDSPWQIEVDGLHTNLPISLNDGKLKVTQEGKGMVLQASFGLRLTYDFQTMVSITVPSTFYGQVSGLCGNYNGNAGDDLKLRSGVQTDDVSVFGAAWRLEGDDLTCGSACPNDGCAKPDDQVRSNLGKQTKCGLISDANGPLAACHSTLPPADFQETCIYNSFVAGANAESVCPGIEAYVSACQAAGVTLKDWRTESFCPADTCPVNSHYTLCTRTCSSNCNSLTSPEICPNVCLEGCKCNDGFVSDGNLCVPVQKCGCSINGTYLKSGETAYMSACSQRCRCSTHNNPACEATACPAETSCNIANGFLECLPANSTCTLNNGNSITSFDGSRFEFKEKGHYVLFHPSSSKMRMRFKVGAKIQLLNGQLTLAGVQVVFEGTVVVVSPQNTLWVENEPVSMPWVSKNKRLEINKTDRNINILHHGKVAVTLRIHGDMSVTVSRSLLSHVRGLCASHRSGPQKIKWSHMASTKNMKNRLGKLFAWKWFSESD